jgi:hypothetical protein
MEMVAKKGRGWLSRGEGGYAKERVAKQWRWWLRKGEGG